MYTALPTNFHRRPSGPPEGAFAPNAPQDLLERGPDRFFGQLVHLGTTQPTNCVRPSLVETLPTGQRV